jgi:AraC-like DNA-binding protein
VGYPESIGHYRDDPTHKEQRASRQLNFYNLHFVLSGKGYVHVGNQTIELKTGDGFLYGPGLPQQYHSDVEHPWEVLWVHFFGPGLEQLLDGRGTVQVWLFSTGEVQQVASLFEQLLRCGIIIKQGQEAHISALLYELIVDIVQNAEDLHESPAFGHRQRILKSADWIRAHSHEPLTLEQIANVSGYSAYYFSRRFHQLMGRTPIQFVLESRIVKSKQLLTSTNWSVQHISELVGFVQSSYFIRRFRSLEGITPEQFRQLRG